MRILNSLTMAQRLLTLVAFFLVGFVAYAALALKIQAETKVNGPVYQRIVQGKDLIADVLPPPAYIIEAYLTVLELAQSKSAEQRQALIQKFDKLKAHYERRYQFWLKEPLEDKLANVFLTQAHDPAVEFFRLGSEELIPALHVEDSVKVAQAVERMRGFYVQHRNAVDQVVQMTQSRNRADEAMARERIAAADGRMHATLLFFMLVGIAIAVLIGRSLMNSLGAEPATLGEAARKIAEGQLDLKISVSPGDEHSVLYQIERMRQQLQVRTALEKSKQESDLRALNAETQARIAEQHARAANEKQEIYVAMARATQHVLNNLLNQLVLFKLAAGRSEDFDHKVLLRLDAATHEANELIAKLSSLPEPSRQNIEASVAPKFPPA